MVPPVHHHVDADACEREDDGLRQQFAHQGCAYASAACAQPVGGGAGLYFVGDGVGGHQQYHKLQDAEEKRRAEVVAVVQPGVARGVGVDGHGLQQHSGHSLGGALLHQVGLHQSARCAHRHGLKSLEHQRARHVDCEIVVVGEGRSAAGHGVALEIVRNHEEADDVAALHGLHGLVVACGLHLHVDQFIGVERAHELARHRGVVEVDHSSRNFQRQPFAEDADEEKHHGKGNQHHPADVYRAGGEALNFAAHDRYKSGAHQFMING